MSVPAERPPERALDKFRRQADFRRAGFWRGEPREKLRDRGLTTLLIVQSFALFVIIPGSAAGLRLPTAVPVALLVVSMSSVIFLARQRWAMTAAIALLAATAGSGLARHGWPGREADIANALLLLVTYGTLNYVVMAAVFGPGRVTGHRIRGAVVFYLNVGLMFALVDRVIADMVPEAFRNLPPVADRQAFIAAITYYSFSTLTSVGFGDIVPLHSVARSLANLESVIGQLFPATLLARIVTLELEERRR
jgi:Ion channel